ncbi:MAG: DNA-directed RNA polymerase [bacterium]|nr:DNA-directed RNA polymerase [bacterium]
MKVIDKAVRKTYRFSCPNCGSKLEAECQELVDIGGKVSRFFCPVCRKDRYVSWGELRKKTIYEADNVTR